jgi:hypothetical protein
MSDKLAWRDLFQVVGFVVCAQWAITAVVWVAKACLLHAGVIK